MTGRAFRFVVCAAVLFGLVAFDAAAWGPRARRTIGATALDMLRRQVPDAFTAGEGGYDADMLQGAEAGYQALGAAGPGGAALPAATADEAINSISMEIGLLREARKYRVGSYLAYRMGVLASLVSDVLLPYGICTPQDQYLKEKIESDMDAHLKGFTFEPHNEGRLQDIRVPDAYFLERQRFLEDAKRIIQADYAGGKGYDGYLRTGGQSFFAQAVEAVADTWYSAITGKAGAAPSDRALAWYFVSEIDYLLNVKGNKYEAEKAYEVFRNVGPGLLAAYERVGDLFYDYGARERGVEEWKTALALAGPERQSIMRKLSDHYLKQGRRLTERSASPEAPENVLDDALKAFTLALEYNPQSQDAADNIAKTRVAISEKKERYDLAVQTIASAEKVATEAGNSFSSGAFGAAISSYRRAITLYSSVSEEFKSQHAAAADGVLQANNQITSIINKRLDAAHDQVDKGDTCLEADDFDGAVNAYKQVESLLTDVPGDPSTTHGQNKQKLITEATDKIAKVDEARTRFQAQQEAKRKAEDARKTKAAADAAAGVKPAAPTTGAKPAMPATGAKPATPSLRQKAKK